MSSVGRGVGGGLEEGRRWRSGEGKFLLETCGWSVVVDGLLSRIGVEVQGVFFDWSRPEKF